MINFQFRHEIFHTLFKDLHGILLIDSNRWVICFDKENRLIAMPHSAESQLCAIRHSAESRLGAMPHSAEFFGIARSWNKILSAFTEAIKLTVYKKISHRWSCLPHDSRVFTEFRQHGIPYIFGTSLYSVCYTELSKIPRNYTEFRVTE
jgi:hypothetical protein